ncbi:hypothetical protein JTE90_022483 [Oedothorax gibbosus]|uniref:Uncharacterized protein n=1 Tax=Oedothorax gibbosus TaxID=931172 RepID=A0AAV6V0Q3_9ARAC|nr:hypothetical protein JTE90_022483 [Oedothorax gibbosus]
MSKKEVNPCKKVTVDEVVNGLISINYLEKIREELKGELENSKSYKALMQLAESNIYNPSNITNTPLTNQDVQNTKEKMKEVSSLVLDLDYNITEAVSKKLIDSKCFIEAFIKRVSNLKQIETEQSSSSKHGENQEDSSDAKLNSESDSSVHTSELSSFEEDLIVPNEVLTKDDGQKRISFNAANQAKPRKSKKKKSKRGKNSKKSSKRT